MKNYQRMGRTCYICNTSIGEGGDTDGGGGLFGNVEVFMNFEVFPSNNLHGGISSSKVNCRLPQMLHGRSQECQQDQHSLCGYISSAVKFATEL